MILPAHLVPQPVVRSDPVPQFPCNRPGEPRQALPTIVSRPNSYAFRPGQAGSLRDISQPVPSHTEPSADQREAALGYLPGSTAAEGITERQRREVLGQSIDANAAQAICAITKAWWLHRRPDLEVEPIPRAAAAGVSTRRLNRTKRQQEGRAEGTDTAGRQAATAGGAAPLSALPVAQHSGSSEAAWSAAANPPSACDSTQPSQERAADAVAELLDAQDAAGSTADIWLDHPVLQFLRQGNNTGDQQGEVSQRVRRRARSYYFRGDQLIRKMPNGSMQALEPSRTPCSPSLSAAQASDGTLTCAAHFPRAATAIAT